MADDDLERLFTVRQVANAYHVSEETIRRWIKSGHIPYVPIGPFRLKRLRLSDLKKNEAKNGSDSVITKSSEGTKRTGTR